MIERAKRENRTFECPRVELFASRQTELAWQAGMIDGEGTITITRQMRKGRPSPAYRPYVTVTNTNVELITPFVSMWSGVISKTVDARVDKRWADSYNWYCKQTVVVEFLRSILPFLRGKKNQAEVVLEFMRTKKLFKRSHVGVGGKSSMKGSLPLSGEEITHREKLMVKVQMLNAKSTRSRAVIMGGGDAKCRQSIQVL